MAQDRRERKAHIEAAESLAVPIRNELFSEEMWPEFEQLPPQNDQSWREREALRISTYEKSEHLPPQDDQSWREREALRFAPGDEKGDADRTASQDGMERVHVPQFASPGRGHGGILLAAFIVAVIAAVIAVLAAPAILTVGFWRTQGGAANSTVKAADTPARIAPVAPAPVADAPAPLPVSPAPLSPAPSDTAIGPALNTAPAADAIEQAPKPSPKPGAAKAGKANDRGAGGFYAKVPGPDGTLKYTYFPSGPSGSQPAVPDEAGKPGAGGFYAKVPGPDGTLVNRYFPSRPSR